MNMGGMKNSGCKGCTEKTGRHPGCHAKCERYLKYRAELDEINQKRRIELEKLAIDREKRDIVYKTRRHKTIKGD